MGIERAATPLTISIETCHRHPQPAEPPPPMDSDGTSGDEGEEMCYDMLGIDAATEKEKLEKYTGTVDWSYLKDPFQKDALLYVDASLQLSEVGKVIAGDNKEQVQQWLKTGDVLKPGPPHAEYWESSETRFKAMVVSPFVLIQPLPSGSQ